MEDKDVVKFGVIPLGSGNYFSWSQDIKVILGRKVIESMLKVEVVRIRDIGKMKMRMKMLRRTCRGQ